VIDIVILSVLAVLSGSAWDSIELYGNANLSFGSGSRVRYGSPIFDSRHFERLFSQWANELKNSGVLEKVVVYRRQITDTFGTCVERRE
jgi:hypothetical protein